MSLRSRLTVAFFAISVVPLAAVTLFSYYTSERALRRAAEQQADTLAGELGHRMEWVTSDLERRMDRAWPMPAEGQAQSAPAQGSQPAQPMTMTDHLAGVLGDIAPMVESLEFVPTKPPATSPPPPGADSGPLPATPAPPAAQGVPAAPSVPPVPPVVSTGPAAPGKPRHSQPRRPGHPEVSPAQAAAAGVLASRTVVEMSQVISEAMKRHEGAATRGGQTDMTAWAQALQERINQAVAQMPTREEVAKFQETARAAERSAASRREEARAARMQTITTLKGDALRTDVQENGRPIGRINARLNSDRLFRTVLGMTHRDQREIPFAVDADGRLHSPRSSDRAVVQSLNLAGSMPAEGISVRAVKDWVVATRKDPSGVTFGIARPMGDDLRDLRRVTARNFGLGFAFIALVFAGSVPLARGMTRNLGTLMDGVQRLSRGDLGARVSVRSRDEFGRLGAAFNQMAENLSAHEKLMVEQERIRRELEVCRQIQNEMLPHQPLRLGLAEVMGVSIPAREVGGDFFNYFALPDGEIALLVGDVSGKGVAAALLMANVQATLRARLPLEQDLARLADMLDRDLEQNTPPEVYLTLFVGILDPHRRQLRYVSAGHNTQFLLHARGGLERLASTGRPLGLLAGNGYEERTVTLDAGDSLFFYTDGMVEVENEAGDIMGSDRLEQLLTESPSTEIDALLARIAEAIRAFRGKAEPRDDATMMALRFGGTA